jgi:hypothetical protein
VTPKLILVLALIALGAAFFAVDAIAAGGDSGLSASWLLPAGLASLAVAWFLSLLPVRAS